MPGGQYRLMSVGQQVSIGVAGSHFVTLDAVAKQNSNNAPYCVPNEMICAELGQFLRLPIPPVGIVRESDPKALPWFASLNFNLTGNALPPVDPTTCVASLPDLSTGLLIFDILITNSDRHAGNLAVDVLANPPKMTVFDHSHALFGYHAGLGQQRLAYMKI